jgi:hypothetical protein
LKGIQLSCVLTERASLIVSFEASSLNCMRPVNPS